MTYSYSNNTQRFCWDVFKIIKKIFFSTAFLITLVLRDHTLFNFSQPIIFVREQMNQLAKFKGKNNRYFATGLNFQIYRISKCNRSCKPFQRQDLEKIVPILDLLFAFKCLTAVKCENGRGGKSLGLTWIFTSKFPSIKTVEQYKSNYFLQMHKFLLF